MAFLPPEQQNQFAPQGQTTNLPAGGPAPQTGGSAGAGAAKAAGAPASQGTPTQFGSSASKLGDYLSANAPQIQNQANTVAGNLNTQYGQVSGDITNAANQFGQAVQGGYAAPNQDIVNQALQNPNQFVNNPRNITAFQGQLNDVYKGPQNFESTTPYAGIQNEISQAVQNAGLLNTPAGLQSYFAKNSGPNQTQASNTLDALLLQGTPEAKQTVQTAANQFQNLTPQFNTAVTNADQSVQAAQQAAQNAQAYTQGQVNPYIQNFQNTLQNQTTTAQNKAAAQNAQLLADVQNHAISPEDAKALGLTIPQVTDLWQATNQANLPKWLSGPSHGGALSQTQNIDWTPFLQQTAPSAITTSNIATPEQYTQEAALSQLIGQSYNPVLNQANAAQAGTAPTNFNTFDYANALKYANDIGSGETNAAQALANQLGTQNQANYEATKGGGFFSNPLAQYLANPLITVPQQIQTAKKKI